MSKRGSERRKMDDEVLVRLRAEEAAQMRQLAGRHEVSGAEFVRRLIQQALGQVVPPLPKLRAAPELLIALARASCEVGRQTGQLKLLCKALRESGETDLRRRAERLLERCEKTQADFLAELNRLS